MLAAYLLEHAAEVAKPQNIIWAVGKLAPFWGHLNVSDIREGTCRAYIRWRQENTMERDAKGRKKRTSPPKASSIRNELSYLAAAVEHDWRSGRLTRQVPVWLPGRPEPRERWLTHSETAKLLRAARHVRGRGHLALFVLIGLYTGQRCSAILDLRWPQVDFANGVIDFNPPGRARTKKQRPKVPMPRQLALALRLAKRRGTDLGHVITYAGQPLGHIGQAFSRAVKDAGLTGKVTPHVLRHTAITWMVQRGVPLWEVAGYVGVTTALIERVYGHHAPEHLSRAKQAMERVR